MKTRGKGKANQGINSIFYTFSSYSMFLQYLTDELLKCSSFCTVFLWLQTLKLSIFDILIVATFQKNWNFLNIYFTVSLFTTLNYFTSYFLTLYFDWYVLSGSFWHDFIVRRRWCWLRSVLATRWCWGLLWYVDCCMCLLLLLIMLWLLLHMLWEMSCHNRLKNKVQMYCTILTVDCLENSAHQIKKPWQFWKKKHI